MHRISIFTILGISIFFSGCASILHGTTQEISVSSNPSGAKVQADGNNLGNTPTKITVKRKTDHILVLTKDGYEQEQRTIMHVVSGAVCGNIIAGGFIGWGVDALTGAQYKLVPETVHVELKQVRETSPEVKPAQQKSLSIEDRLKKLQELHEQKNVTDEEYEANRQLILKSLSNGSIM